MLTGGKDGKDKVEVENGMEKQTGRMVKIA